jgi:hypothetical protein
MRSFSRLSTISLSLVAVLIISCSTVLHISGIPPKESKIVTEFGTHRAAYERLRTMLSEDKEVGDVATWGITLNDSPFVRKIPPDGGMSVERYQEYLGLMKDIGVDRIGQFGDPHEVTFGVWASGWAGDTRHVHVSWLERQPSNVVASLEGFYRTDKPRRPSYVHIEGNWYIWADW